MGKRRGQLLFGKKDLSRMIASKSRNDAFLESYEELYTRRLLEHHIFSPEFVRLITNYLDTQKSVLLLNELLPYVLHSPQLMEYEKNIAREYLEEKNTNLDFETVLFPILHTCDFVMPRDKTVSLILKQLDLCTQPAESKNFSERLTNLKSTFNLTKSDIEVLLFLFINDTNNLLSTLYNSWTKRDVVRGISLCTSCTENSVTKSLSTSGNLRKFGLVTINKRYSADFEISPSISDFLLMTKEGNIFDNLVKTKKGIIFSLESFPVKDKEKDLCLSLLKSITPVQILLHGSEGSGKTEFAKALAEQVKKQAYFYEREKKDEADVLTTLSLLDSSLSASSGVLIIDEAEDLLDASGRWLSTMMTGNKDDKARINTFLDQVHIPIIWIVNSIDGILPSTRRRFTFSVEFSPLKKERLAQMAESAILNLRISKTAKKSIIQLAGNRNLTGTAIANMKTAVEELSRTYTNEEELIPYVNTLFEANEKLVSGKSSEKNTVEKNYSIDVLNVSIPAQHIIDAVRKISSIREENTENSRGLKMLFHGIPGSGKTELARYIAKKCGKELEIRRASDILSAYVGESEKNIAKMFRDAEKNDTLLLIDEADSFLYSRNNAGRSWEITQVNEFLTSMEEFKGILICTTNCMPNVDTAVLRRFHIKAEFSAITNENTDTLLTSFFPYISVSDENKLRLYRNGPYVPGDFAAVSNAVHYLGTNSEYGEEHIIQSLITEASFRKSKTTSIGF